MEAHKAEMEAEEKRREAQNKKKVARLKERLFELYVDLAEDNVVYDPEKKQMVTTVTMGPECVAILQQLVK